jgi:plasmid maintenance system antidote protein VapI
MREEIHIGQMIRDRLKEKGNTVSWLAREINCSRINVYKIFLKENIDVELLMRISLTLRYNFFTHYAEYCKKELGV